MRTVVSTTLVCLALLLPCGPARADVYVWKDDNGVVHMTDRKPTETNGKVEVLSQPGSNPAGSPAASGAPGAPVRKGAREERVAQMQKAALANPRFAELETLARDYAKSHTYSTADYFVCIDMALEMHNILRTKGFNAQVVAGTTKLDMAATPFDQVRGKLDHAWVIVELEPGLYAPIETTAGVVVNGHVPHNPYYYQGLVFDSPKQAKDTNPLIESINTTCQAAQGMTRDYETHYLGRQPSPQVFEAKGRTEAKIQECNEAVKRYDDLVKKNYRNFY